MALPFSPNQFLDLFGAYNLQLWPAVLALWLVTATMGWQWLRRGQLDSRVLFGVLAVHWAWSALAYHWAHFRTINPAAGLFAGLFLVQATLFIWLGTKAPRRVTVAGGPRKVAGAILVLYGLLYPLIGFALGMTYPRMPLFGVPCPTTLVTAGFLVAATGLRRSASVVPLLWALVGSSAAFTLGMHADWALTLAAVVLLVDLVFPAALGKR